MKIKNIKIKNIIAPIAVAATIVPALSLFGCGNKKQPIFSDYFEIQGTKVVGFKKGITQEELKEVCKDGKLRFPEGITEIANGAFDSEHSIANPFAEEIVIPKGCQTIGERAFYGNVATTVTWQDSGSSIQTIGKSAFAFCEQLTNFKFPANLFKKAENAGARIGTSAFFGCKSLSVLDFSNYSYNAEQGLANPNWEFGAFTGLPATGKVAFNKSYEELEGSKDELFSYAHLWTRVVCNGSLSASGWTEAKFNDGAAPTDWSTQVKCVPTEWLDINSDGVLVGPRPAWTDDGFTVAVIPETVKSIASDAKTKLFSAKAGVADWVFTWTQLTDIPASACEGLTGTTRIYLPASLTTINAKAFYNSAWTPVFADGTKLSSCGESCFEKCSTITSVKFASGATVAAGAFKDAANLSSIYMTEFAEAPKTGWVADSFTGAGSTAASPKVYAKTITGNADVLDQWKLNIRLKAVLTACGLSFEKWTMNPDAKLTSTDQLFNINDDGIITGWAGGTEGQGELTNDEVRMALIEISGGTFSGKITLPKGAKGVATNAFVHTDNSTKIPSTVTELEFSTNDSCTIGASAFSGATSLTKITLSSNISSIGASAFGGLTSLDTVDVSSVDYAGASAWAKAPFDADAFKGSKADYKINNKSYNNKVDQWRYNNALKNAFQLGNHDRFVAKATDAVLFNIESGAIKGFVTGDQIEPKTLTDTELLDLAAFLYGDKIFRIPSTATSIADSAFMNASGASTIPAGFKKVDFAENSTCTTIGSKAFYQAFNKESGEAVSIDFTNATKLTTIGAHAFSGAKITGISLPASLTSVGAGAFYETTMTSLVFPTFTNDVTFGSGCFAGNTSLTTIDMSAYGTSLPTRWKGCDITMLSNIATSGGKIIVGTDAGTTFLNFLKQYSNTITNYTEGWSEQKKA